MQNRENQSHTIPLEQTWDKCLIVKSDSLFQYKSGKAGKQKSPCCEARAFPIMVYILRMARKGRLMTIDESNLRKMNCQTMVIEA